MMNNPLALKDKREGRKDGSKEKRERMS